MDIWTYEGNFRVDKSMVNNGRFIDGKIPKVVTGSFKCNSINLTSLEGGPKEIGGDFYCSDNNLTSLIGCPVEVGVTFDCNDNELTSLEGGPGKVGGHFLCSHNNLTSLEGCPIKVGGFFSCSNNQLTTLEGCPKEIRGHFYGDDNLIIEGNFISSGSFKQDFYKDLLNYCINNKINLERVKSWPKDFLTNNILESSKGICKFKL